VISGTYSQLVFWRQEIPGMDRTVAAVIIAEMGVNMSVFASVSQLASWAGLCPGNNESAGKRKSSHIPKGNVY
jgi:transposase